MTVTNESAGLRAPLAQIRAAEPSDYAAMVKLCDGAEVFTATELDSALQDFAACDSALGDRLVVHQQGEGALQGFIQYSPAPITDGSWYIYWIAVAKQAQGAGIGATLLAYAEADLRSIRARQILIETSAKPAYDAARSFYLGRGYHQIARIPDYYTHGDDKCIFLKKL